MAAPVRLVCPESFPSHIPALDVLIKKQEFNNFFPDCKESSLTLLYSYCKSNPGILIHACLLSEEETPRCEPVVLPGNKKQALQVYTSKLFLKHYGLLKESAGVVRLFQPLVLSKVVIGTRSRQSFKWATSEKFSNGLHALAKCPEQTLLARQGDPLSLPFHPLLFTDATQGHQHVSDLVVLETSPVMQGVITVNTSLVVIDCRDISPYQTLNEQLNHNYSRGSMSLIASDFAHYANSLSSGDSLLGNSALVSSGFSGFVQALECRVEIKVVDVLNLSHHGGIRLGDDQHAGLDMDNAIFLSKNLLLKLGLFNGEWVVLSTLSHSDKSKATVNSEPAESPAKPEDKKASKAKVDKHLASVVVVDFAKGSNAVVSENVGVISLVHWFNLTGGEPLPCGSKTVKIKRWNPPSTLGHQLSESASRSASPHFAKELHIEAIRSPEFSFHSLHDALLHQHFSTPRLVWQGAVLSIPTAGHPEVIETSHDGITRWPTLCFKVKKVSGPGDTGPYLADVNHSQLYMEGSTNMSAPWSGSHEAASLWTNMSPAGLSSTVEQLVTIIHPYVNESSSAFQGRATILLQGPNGCGKVTVVQAACRRLHLHLLKYDCVTLCADTAAACEAKMRSAFQKAEVHKPCVLLLRNFQLLGQLRDGTEMDARVLAALGQLIEKAPSRVIVVASVSIAKDLSASILSVFVHQMELERPTEEQRRAMLGVLAEGLPLGKNVNLNKLARQTVGFVLGDLCALMTLAGKVALKRILKTSFPAGVGLQQQQEEEEDVCASGVLVQDEDLSVALDSLQEMHSQALGAPKIPSVRWQDIGGLQQVKRDILDTIQLPLEHPELAAMGLKRSGLLLYGPPGTGKTLLAKAVATECSLTFLSVKGPELLNMYVGQSEENVREVFSMARAAAPCIIFFDELDSLAPNRGKSGDSGGVMDRVVSQLLAELDGLHSSGDVFVIGATNRPDLLDQSLLRPGRFDKLVYVGINDNKDSQLQVLKAITRKFKLEPGVNLAEVVARCPSQMTGADLYALCSDAMMTAVKRKIQRISEGLETEDGDLTLSDEDFQRAVCNVQPSVSEQELLKYKLIQQKLTAK